MQSNESHKRICDRLFAILNQHIFSLCESLTDEKKARARLEEFPALIAYNRLKDFTVVDEPFFRSLLVASAKVSMCRFIWLYYITHIWDFCFVTCRKKGNLTVCPQKS